MANRKKETPAPDLLRIIEDFTAAVQHTDFSDIAEVSDEMAQKLEVQIEELRKSVERFTKMSQDLYKAANLTKEDKENILKDPSKNTQEIREYAKRLDHAKKQTEQARDYVKEQARTVCSSELTDPAEVKPAKELDAKEAAKKRKTLRGKKNWMPL